MRAFGASGGFDWDLEAAYQVGAWTVATDVGNVLPSLPLSPRVGLRADLASGDGRPRGGRLGTFNPLYTKLPYFSEANLLAPANLMDLHSSVTLRLAPGLAVSLGWNALWQHRTAGTLHG